MNGLEAVNVARPSKWGNPFPIGREGPFGRCAPDAAGAVGFFCDMLNDRQMQAAAGYPRGAGIHHHIRHELRGFNLACFCELDSPCHADVLLEIANA